MSKQADVYRINGVECIVYDNKVFVPLEQKSAAEAVFHGITNITQNQRSGRIQEGTYSSDQSRPEIDNRRARIPDEVIEQAYTRVTNGEAVGKVCDDVGISIPTYYKRVRDLPRPQNEPDGIDDATVEEIQYYQKDGFSTSEIIIAMNNRGVPEEVTEYIIKHKTKEV